MNSDGWGWGCRDPHRLKLLGWAAVEKTRVYSFLPGDTPRSTSGQLDQGSDNHDAPVPETPGVNPACRTPRVPGTPCVNSGMLQLSDVVMYC